MASGWFFHGCVISPFGGEIGLEGLGNKEDVSKRNPGHHDWLGVDRPGSTRPSPPPASNPPTSTASRSRASRYSLYGRGRQRRPGRWRHLCFQRRASGRHAPVGLQTGAAVFSRWRAFLLPGFGGSLARRRGGIFRPSAGADRRRVLAPQVLRLALPGLGNCWLSALKETALVSVTGKAQPEKIPALVVTEGILPAL